MDLMNQLRTSWDARDVNHITEIVQEVVGKGDCVVLGEWARENADWVAKDLCDGIRSVLVRLKKTCGEDVDTETVEWTVGWPDGVVVNLAVACARLLRNCCVDKVVQGTYFVDLVPYWVDVLERMQVLYEGGTFEEWKMMVLTLGRVAVQFLCNFCVGNDDNQARVWGLLLKERPQAFLKLFQFAIEHEDFPLLRNIASLLYICMVDHTVRTEELCDAKSVVILLLNGGGLALSKLNHTDKEEEGASSSSSPHLIEFHTTCVWIVGKIANRGKMNKLLSEEGNQTILSILLSLWLGHRLDEEEEQKGDKNTDIENDAVEESFHALEKFYVNTFSTSDISESSNCRQYSLRLLGSYAMDQRIYRQQVCKEMLLHSVLEQLEKATNQKDEVDFGFRGDLLRVVANLCYHHRENQDAIRRKPNGIFTILNQCNVDENSPFLREWAIVCIRNITEGNLENQQIIAETRLQGAQQVSLLEKAGLRVEMTQDGKPNLVRL